MNSYLEYYSWGIYGTWRSSNLQIWELSGEVKTIKIDEFAWSKGIMARMAG